MKKMIITLLVLAASAVQATACDICGGVNHLNPYLFPHLSRSYIGLSYVQQQYRLQEAGSVLEQSAQTMVLTGQYRLSNKFQITALLPYQFASITSGADRFRQNGLGDATLLLNYVLWQKKIKSANHAFAIGAGLKLPTGHYNTEKGEGVTAPSFQLGSGGMDYLVNASYRLKLGQFAFNALGAYKYNTANEQGYRFGDVTTIGATTIYVVRFCQVSLAPYLQAMQETHFADADDHLLQAHTKGSVLYGGGGLDLSFRQYTLGFNYQTAMRQNLMQGDLQARPRLSARFSVTL
jgi:hypothetical protein